MYETYYNLRAEPFRLSPDHRFCYVHSGYAKARAYMAYAFMRAEGFVMITGRPGTGKTTLIGDLIESLARDNVTTANLVCTQLQADDLLKTVAYSFGVGISGGDKAELLQRLNVLFHNWHRDGRRALLIVDEAQDLSATAMEELRLLTNIQVDGQPLLQIFLLGQPELRDLILSPPMEQVHQRIVAASHLEALEPAETEEYVRHRLDAVGWRGDPAISKSIFPLIYKFSEGVPRRINLICSRLLLHGSVEQRHEIGVQDIRTVIRELQGENLAAGTRFEEADFELDDEFEQITFVAEPPQGQAPPVEDVHAVGDDEPEAPVSGTYRVESATQDIETAPVPETPDSESMDMASGANRERYEVESLSRPEPDSGSEREPASGVSGQPCNMPEIITDAADIHSSLPTAIPVEREPRKKTGVSGVILGILLIALCAGAGYFAVREGAWVEWRDKAQVLWDRFSAQLATVAPAVQQSQAVVLAPGVVGEITARHELSSAECMVTLSRPA